MSTTDIVIALVLFVVGLAVAIRVTLRLHEPAAPAFWRVRLGIGRLRRANLPVGGTIALVGAAVCEGHVQAALLGAGIGMALGAMGCGIVHPSDAPE